MSTSIPIASNSPAPRVKAYAVDLPVDAVNVLQREARRRRVYFRELMAELVTAAAQAIEAGENTLDCIAS